MTATAGSSLPDDRRQRRHVVVIGAGIAGLAAAYEVQNRLPDARLTLIDCADRTGGKLRLGDVAGQPVDLGAEAVLNRRPEGVDLARAVGLAESLEHPVTTSAGVWSRGEVRPLPRTVMGVPADLDGLAESGIVDGRAVARAAREPGMPRLDVSEDVAIGALVAQRLGDEVRDRLVEPLLGGVYAGRADELSLHATVPQLVPALAEHGGLLAAAAAVAAASAGPSASAKAPVFAGLAGGVGRLASATEAALRERGATVRCRTTAREITRTPTGFRVVCGPTVAPESIEADAVIVAVPASSAARLLQELTPTAAAELASLDYASMAIVTVAFAASDVPPSLHGSGFLVPPVDGHAVKAVTYSSRKWGWLSDRLLVVRCSVGRYGDERMLQRDDAALVESALTDLREAAGLRARPLDSVVTRWGGALPQYAVGHLDRVRRIREQVALVPGLAVCGAAYAGVGIPACIATGRDAGTRVADHLGRGETLEA